MKYDMISRGKGCCFVAAQYANKGELVLRCTAKKKKKKVILYSVIQQGKPLIMLY